MDLLFVTLLYDFYVIFVLKRNVIPIVNLNSRLYLSSLSEGEGVKIGLFYIFVWH